MGEIRRLIKLEILKWRIRAMVKDKTPEEREKFADSLIAYLRYREAQRNRDTQWRRQ